MVNNKKHLEILYSDDSIVAVNKPAGLLTLPDRFKSELPNVRGLLMEKFGEIFTVHRLDKATTGVMLFARTAEAHKNLNTQFQQHTIIKVYHGIVSGVVENDEMDIDIPIAEDTTRKGLMRPTARGKNSLTKIKVTERFKIATLLECKPITGRQHQIRVHLAAIGHPLLVDVDYGTLTEFMLSTIKRRFKLAKETTERPLLSRTPLHAYSLTFVHPDTNEIQTISAEYPKDIRATLQALRKYSVYVSYSSDEYFY